MAHALNNCTLGADRLALYALSALGEDETRNFEQHLCGCRLCSRTLSDQKAFRATMLAYIQPEIAGARSRPEVRRRCRRRSLPRT
jgi:hypothetical protein